MTVHADVTAVAGGRDGSPWSHLTADSHAELPDSPCADRDSRTAWRRTDPHHRIDLEASGMATLSAVSSSTRLDSGGTTWRLRSLIAMGHDSSRMARALNVSPQTTKNSSGTTPSRSVPSSATWPASCGTPGGTSGRPKRPAASAGPPAQPGGGPNATAGQRQPA
jgi:hypothetical protein